MDLVVCEFCLENFSTKQAWKAHLVEWHYDGPQENPQRAHSKTQNELNQQYKVNSTIPNDLSNEAVYIKTELQDEDEHANSDNYFENTNVNNEHPEIDYDNPVLSEVTQIKRENPEIGAQKELQNKKNPKNNEHFEYEPDIQEYDNENFEEGNEGYDNNENIESTEDLGSEDQFNKDPDNNTTCSYCLVEFISVNELEEHAKIHANKENPYSCNVCGNTFDEFIKRKAHMLIHGPKNYKCDTCSFASYQVGNLKRHLSSHTKKPSFICKLCFKIFYDKEDFRNHNIASHAVKNEPLYEDRPYSCPHCDKKFKDKSALTVHKVVHFDKRFVCTDCPKSFHRSTQLRIHMKIHTALPILICKICFTIFHEENEYKIHTTKLCKRAPKVCEYCQEKFPTGQKLAMHRRKHENKQAPFKCPHCSKRFRSDEVLQDHLKSQHAEDGRLSCQYCSKEFKDRKYLVFHEKSHTGQNLRQCKICNNYYGKNSMTTHMRTHTGIFLFNFFSPLPLLF